MAKALRASVIASMDRMWSSSSRSYWPRSGTTASTRKSASPETTWQATTAGMATSAVSIRREVSRECWAALRAMNTVARLVALPTTLFVTVYLACTAAAVRLPTGRTRVAAALARLTVAAVLAFAGWALAAALLVAVLGACTLRQTADAGPAPSCDDSCKDAGRVPGSAEQPLVAGATG
jgi:hypothetical protein